MQQEAHQLVGSQNAAPLEFDLKPSEAAFSTVFLNFDDCHPEVVSDVISDMVNQDVGVDVCVNLGDSRLRPSEASFSVVFRTSIASDRKYIVTSYPVRL